MEIELKMAILKSFRSQADFAMVVEEHETKVSQIIRGRRKLDPDSAKKWIAALGCRPEILKSATRVI